MANAPNSLEDVISKDDIESRYIRENFRGCGAFGNVHIYGIKSQFAKAAQHKRIAVKTTKDDYGSADREIRNLVALMKEPQIVNIISYSRSPYVIVMECCNCDLDTFIKQKRFDISLKDLQKFWNEVLHSLKSLKEKGILHRDVKPSNFLVDFRGNDGSNIQDVTFKLGDLGCGRGFNKDLMERGELDELTKNLGTDGYISPEIAPLFGKDDNTGAYTSQADLWSLSVTVFYIASKGKKPFTVQRLLSLHQEITTDSKRNIDIKAIIREHLGDSFSSIFSLLVETLKWSPVERYTAEKCFNIVEHMQKQDDDFAVVRRPAAAISSTPCGSGSKKIDQLYFFLSFLYLEVIPQVLQLHLESAIKFEVKEKSERKRKRVDPFCNTSLNIPTVKFEDKETFERKRKRVDPFKNTLLNISCPDMYKIYKVLKKHQIPLSCQTEIINLLQISKDFLEYGRGKNNLEEINDMKTKSLDLLQNVCHAMFEDAEDMLNSVKRLPKDLDNQYNLSTSLTKVCKIIRRLGYEKLTRKLVNTLQDEITHLEETDHHLCTLELGQSQIDKMTCQLNHLCDTLLSKALDEVVFEFETSNATGERIDDSFDTSKRADAIRAQMRNLIPSIANEEIKIIFFVNNFRSGSIILGGKIYLPTGMYLTKNDLNEKGEITFSDLAFDVTEWKYRGKYYFFEGAFLKYQNPISINEDVFQEVFSDLDSVFNKELKPESEVENIPVDYVQAKSVITQSEISDEKMKIEVIQNEDVTRLDEVEVEDSVIMRSMECTELNTQNDKKNLRGIKHIKTARMNEEAKEEETDPFQRDEFGLH